MKLPAQESMLDLVCAYCVVHNVGTEALASLSFAEVSLALVKCAVDNPQVLSASAEIHKYYQFCHVDCHMKRLRQFIADGYKWLPGGGPDQIKVPEGTTIQ